jgi:hypothetical protein
MGRPIKKKFFGDLNKGSSSTRNDDGIGGEGVASVTLGGTWSGFASGTTTVTFSAPELPTGVTATGVAVINGGGTITSITITEGGSGYKAAPTVTIADPDVGAETTGTAVAVLTVTEQNAFNVNAYLLAKDGGVSSKVADIIKQEASQRYLVRTADGVGQCILAATNTLAAGEMSIVATDANGSTYWIIKLTARRAILKQRTMSGSYAFADTARAGWTIGAASAGFVSIANA